MGRGGAKKFSRSALPPENMGLFFARARRLISSALAAPWCVMSISSVHGPEIGAPGIVLIHSLGRQVLKRFCKTFLKVPLACWGSTAATLQPNGLWNSQKTFYKTSFKNLPPQTVMSRGGIFEAGFGEILCSPHLQWAGKRKFAP